MGGLSCNAEVWGTCASTAIASFLATIDQMLAVWTGEAPYDLKGEFHRVSTERTLVSEIGQAVFNGTPCGIAPGGRRSVPCRSLIAQPVLEGRACQLRPTRSPSGSS